MKSLIKETCCDIPDVAIDRAHRIEKGYNDEKTNARYKSIIVGFTIFGHITMFYQSTANFKIMLSLNWI